MHRPNHQTYSLGMRRQPVCVRPVFLPVHWPVLLLALLLLAGCRTALQPAPTDGPQVLNTLPQGWTPVTFGTDTLFNRNATNWIPINIDDDLTTEYLLFFTYDNSQVGAMIYDQQIGSTGVVNVSPVPAPNQPAGAYIPYQVEPSYWQRSDAPDTVGYVAPPNTGPQAISVVEVQRYPDGEPNMAGTANPEPGDEVPLTNEAIIYGGNSTYGGNSVITVLWWRNSYNGYGIAQMAASGGLTPVAPVPPPEEGVLRPLQRVDGLVPLTGLLERSVMCRKIEYMRADAGEPPDVIEPIYQSAVRYVASDGGIVFCYGAPAYPYYPEGVVLAYLRPPPAGAPDDGVEPADPAQAFLWSDLDEAQRATINDTVALTGTDGASSLVVRELRAPASVALAPDVRTADGPDITTSVCAEVVSADGTQLKRLLFDLLYEPVQEIGGAVIAERFVITGVTDITDVVLNCALIMP
jgi:hypothetical protein